jgi:hypothetical protein
LIEATVKTCFKCGVAKEREEFYRHPDTADGLLGKCKSCTRLEAKIRRSANHEKHVERDRRRDATAERKAAKALYLRRHRKAHPERDAARSKVLRAIRAGKISRRPCAACGSPSAEAHHEDYSKPMAVQWLCRRHHHTFGHGHVAAGR